MKREEETIRLSDHFTYRRLLRYTVPPVIMMIFTSVYSVVDGLFVSNFAGKTPLAAVNFIMPMLMMLSVCGFMFGSGGSALIGKLLGEGRREDANRVFSMVIYVTLGGGLILTVIGLLLLKPVSAALGASGEMLKQAIVYGRICICGGTAFVLQVELQSLMPTAEKPKLGLCFTVAAGCTNIVLDALFVGLFGWGIVGAAAASTIGMLIGGVGPLIYFARPNTSLLRLGRPWFSGRDLLQICTNGASELMSNISMSLVGMLYNVQLMKYAGENGVAAYGVIMYVNFIFLAVFIGYSMGTAPVISYQYGAQNTGELRNLLRKSTVIILTASLAMLLLSELLSAPLSAVFTSYDRELYRMTVKGFRIYAFSFLLSGIPIFGSSFFTALNNGAVSALISFVRTLVFEGIAVLLLPVIFGLDGIWYAIIAAELAAVVLTVICIFCNRRKYHYLPEAEQRAQ